MTLGLFIAGYSGLTLLGSTVKGAFYGAILGSLGNTSWGFYKTGFSKYTFDSCLLGTIAGGFIGGLFGFVNGISICENEISKFFSSPSPSLKKID